MSTSAVATGLLAPVALGASGDLDPEFADLGRLGPIAELKGPARSLEALDDEGILLGGGYLESSCRSYYCWYDPEFEASNFVDALTEDGGIDASYHATVISDVEVFDIARQADGKVVAVGRRVGRSRIAPNNLVVFRLDAEGPLDTGFGNNGIFELDPELYGYRNQANSVLVDPEGRIVIAGARDESLMVLRLDAAGALDASFGSGGILTGPAHDYSAGSRIARTASGAYRVTTTDGSGCRVIGVNAEGAIDESFGIAGYAPVPTAGGNAIACYSMVSQDDGRLLLTGIAAGQAFATRLLANGASDPAFAGTDVAASMSEATAIAVADDGKILVAGNGVRGATIMRLQATGQLDTEFGNAGATIIDLPSENGSTPLIHELAVAARRQRNRRGRRLLARSDAAVRGPVAGRRWRRQPGRAQYRAAQFGIGRGGRGRRHGATHRRIFRSGQHRITGLRRKEDPRPVARTTRNWRTACTGAMATSATGQSRCRSSRMAEPPRNTNISGSRSVTWRAERASARATRPSAYCPTGRLPVSSPSTTTSR